MSHNPLSINALGYLSSGTGSGVDRPIVQLSAQLEGHPIEANLEPPMVVVGIKKRELISVPGKQQLAAFEVD